jgi:hypothetical protein
MLKPKTQVIVTYDGAPAHGVVVSNSAGRCVVEVRLGYFSGIFVSRSEYEVRAAA